MADRPTDPNNSIHLDVDWLVGKRTDPRHRISLPQPRKSQAAGVLLGLGFALALLVLWPKFSEYCIRNHLSTDLATQSSENDGVPRNASQITLSANTPSIPQGISSPLVYKLSDIDPSRYEPDKLNLGASLLSLRDSHLPTWETTTPLPNVPRPENGMLQIGFEPDNQLRNGGGQESLRPAQVTLVSSSNRKLGGLESVQGNASYLLGDSAAEATRLESASRRPTILGTETVEGLENHSLESLLSMLSSSQERLVRLVCDELFRRNVPTQYVEIAMDLARGKPEEQMTLMDQLVRTPGVDPLPILSWMALNADRRVRHRAILLIGAMEDPEAIKRLRSLVNREPDIQLQQVIQHALASDGSYYNRGTR